MAKAEFISKALSVHRRLFDYVRVTEETEVHEIHITPEGVSFVIGDERIRMFAPPEEARVAPIEVMNFGAYEPAETRVMDLLSSGAKEILDIGANIGWHAVRFALRNPAAQVHAFEPMSVAHSFLQRNVSANGLGRQVTCYNYGLSSINGHSEFFVAPTGGTNASLMNVSGATDARAVMGMTLTLDQWSKDSKRKPDFIKCDVEGAELLVFRGGKNTLERYKPVVFAELLRKWSKPFGYHPNDVLSLFGEIGYVCYAIDAATITRMDEIGDETPMTNFAFVHSQEHHHLIDQLEVLK